MTRRLAQLLSMTVHPRRSPLVICSCFVLVVALTACGGSSSPTSPTVPIFEENPRHNLGVVSGSSSWKILLGNAYFQTSIENINPLYGSGPDCAHGTTVSVYFMTDGERVGGNYPMGAIGTSGTPSATELSAMTIRNDEVVALRTLTWVPRSIYERSGERSYGLNITANAVRCP